MAEVWVINNMLQITKALSSAGGFTSNGETFSLMKTTTDGRLRFYGASGNYMDVYANNAWVPGIGDYKSVTFSEAQAGEFRAWLESNATLQEDTNVVEYLTTNIDLKKVANAIRAKGGTTAKLSFPEGFALAISNIPTGASGATKETWVIKDNAPVDENSYELAKTDISFSSGGTKFVAFGVYTDDVVIWLTYHTDTNKNIEVGSFEPGMGEDKFHWQNNAYKKLTFDTPPTGALLTWLQSNATKQPDDTAIQDTKALTITSNGTVSVTPDAPYDALKKVDVTVDVASGGGTETTSVDVYGSSETIDQPIFCTWQTANGWLGTSEFELTNSNGDVLFTIPDVLVGGYIVFTKDPMNQAFFNVVRVSGVEVLDVNPMPSSGDIANASIVVKVVEPGANFELYVSSV